MSASIMLLLFIFYFFTSKKFSFYFDRYITWVFVIVSIYIFVKYKYRLEIGLFKILIKVIIYNINNQFHDTKLCMIYYIYKVCEVNFFFFKLLNKN
jgi:hypothetical protein